MAIAEILFPSEFLSKVDSLQNKLPSIAEKSLDKAGKIVENELKKRLSSVIGMGASDRSSGELAASLGISPIKEDKHGGYNIKVGFNEPRRIQPKSLSAGKKYTKKRTYYVQTNAMIANVLEYGRRKTNQPPRPFLKPTENSTRAEVINIIKRIYDEEIKKL